LAEMYLNVYKAWFWAEPYWKWISVLKY
jgi:hypothetical protein